MCKLAGWTGHNDLPLVRSCAAHGLRAAHNVIKNTERDGFGFAQAGTRGLHARFVGPQHFLGLDALPQIMRMAGDDFEVFDVSAVAEQTGEYNPRKHVICHGRTATHGQGLRNTHPFRHKGWTLVHNGVVSWEGEATKEHEDATCDSQHILYALTDHDGDVLAQKEALKNITGYAAFLALSPKGTLIVAVDDTAQLHAGITNKGRWIFGTTAEIVDAIAKSWNCKTVNAYRLKAWTWMEFSPAGGKPRVSNWFHGKATYRETKYSGKSLGHSYPSYGGDYYTSRGTKSAAASATAIRTETRFEKKDEGTYITREVPAREPANQNNRELFEEDEILDGEIEKVVTGFSVLDENGNHDEMMSEAELAMLQQEIAEAPDLNGVGDFLPRHERGLV
jgi:predicted glutamine amidotransferase